MASPLTERRHRRVVSRIGADGRRRPRQSRRVIPFNVALIASALAGCGDDDDQAPGGDGANASVFLTSNVVFGDDSQSTYVQPLPSLEAQDVDLEKALEFPGWADLWVLGERALVADGESPRLTSYAPDARGNLVEGGRVSFQGYGAEQVAFWGHLFTSETKAYWFNTTERQIVIWNPNTLEIGDSFPLPELPDRGAQLLAGPTADRSSVVRGNRAYVPFYWANWDDYSLSEDSVILVIDATTNQIINEISVPCPEINFATVDDEGTIYFSNWGFSAIATLLDGKAKACAVRILDGADEVDPDWSLTFADITDGREASSLRWLGNGKALLTVLHDERLELSPHSDRSALADSANWRLWMVDLENLSAEALDALPWHAPGLYGTRIDGETFLSVPSADYASTTTYRVSGDATFERLWESTGWQTRLFKLR